MTATTTLRTPADAARWLQARVHGTLRMDSRAVRVGDGFFAWPGSALDGRNFVADALARGAAACLVEGQPGAERAEDGRVAAYAGLKVAAGPIASTYYGEPSRALRTVAVTGTNGKSSTAWWIAAALGRLADPVLAPCALIGTLGSGIPPAVENPELTTPEALVLQRQLRAFADQGVRACALEASSIGLAEHRLDGTAITVAVFTNFSQDHLDYHGTMEAYWVAKARLFDWPRLQAAVVNLDDAKGVALAEQVRDRGVDVWSYALDGTARLAAEDVGHGARGYAWDVCEAGRRVHFDSAVVGRYNVANILAVVGTLRALGVSLEDAARACRDLPAVPGRLERIEIPGAPLAVVDFAHTPDALDNCLRALRPLAQQRGGRLWCVFGCGGNRDRGKRPLMAQVAVRLADRVVVTSDNPRDEDPCTIIDEIVAGLPTRDAAWAEADRARAIAAALAEAAPQDVVLIAGKGHERTQEIAGVRHPFSDQDHARAALRNRTAGVGAPQ